MPQPALSPLFLLITSHSYTTLLKFFSQRLASLFYYMPTTLTAEWKFGVTKDPVSSVTSCMQSVTKVSYLVGISIICLKYIPQCQYIALGNFYYQTVSDSLTGLSTFINPLPTTGYNKSFQT